MIVIKPPYFAHNIVTIISPAGELVDAFFEKDKKWVDPVERSKLFRHAQSAGKLEVSTTQYSVFREVIKRIQRDKILPQLDAQYQLENIVGRVLTNHIG